MAEAPSVELIDPTDARWSSALACTVHDVYDTPAYVSAEARRLNAEPVGCLVDEGGRLFFLPLLLRRVCEGGARRDRTRSRPTAIPASCSTTTAPRPRTSRTHA